MVAPDMTGHPPLHERAERRVAGRLQQEMKMIRHEAETEHLHRILRFGSGEQIQQGGVIPAFVKYGGVAVAAIEDMEGVTGHMAARNAGHGGEGRRARGKDAPTKVACPLFVLILFLNKFKRGCRLRWPTTLMCEGGRETRIGFQFPPRSINRYTLALVVVEIITADLMRRLKHEVVLIKLPLNS